MSHSMDPDLLRGGEQSEKTDPRELLVKIMERDGLRVIDLFRRIDDDASWTVSREEFKNGIKVRVHGRLYEYMFDCTSTCPIVRVHVRLYEYKVLV